MIPRISGIMAQQYGQIYFGHKYIRNCSLQYGHSVTYTGCFDVEHFDVELTIIIIALKLGYFVWIINFSSFVSF